MQRTFNYKIRSKICEWLNETTKGAYTKWFKRNTPSWELNINDLQIYNEPSLGKHMHHFLIQEGFSLMEKHESHDVFHVLTDYGTSKEDEIAMQCFLYGNGKKTLYMTLSILTGLVILPEFMRLFYRAYLRGKQAFPMYHLNYKPLLNYPLHKLKWMFNINPLQPDFNIKNKI